MGSLLLAAGAAGKRSSLPHGRIMIHQPLAGMEGTATEILIHAEEFMRMKKQLNGIYQKHTGQSLEKLEADTDRDRFMGPEDACEYGLIDKVLEHQPKNPATPDPAKWSRFRPDWQTDSYQTSGRSGLRFFVLPVS